MEGLGHGNINVRAPPAPVSRVSLLSLTSLLNLFMYTAAPSSRLFSEPYTFIMSYTDHQAPPSWRCPLALSSNALPGSVRYADFFTFEASDSCRRELARVREVTPYDPWPP